jgi:hypothetical protein
MTRNATLSDAAQTESPTLTPGNGTESQHQDERKVPLRALREERAKRQALERRPGVDACDHDLAEMEAACADGMCPLCLAKRVPLAELLAERRKRQGLERRVKQLEAELEALRGKRRWWSF